MQRVPPPLLSESPRLRYPSFSRPPRASSVRVSKESTHLHLQAEEEHDGGAGVVGVLPGDELGHHEPQEGRQDGHGGQGRDGREEHLEIIVAHSTFLLAL